MINRHVIHESCGNFLLSLLFSKKVTLGSSSAWYQFPEEGKDRRWDVSKCGTYQNPTKRRVYINSNLTENGKSTCNYELIAERHTQLIRPWANSSPVHTTSFYFKL